MNTTWIMFFVQLSPLLAELVLISMEVSHMIVRRVLDQDENHAQELYYMRLELKNNNNITKKVADWLDIFGIFFAAYLFFMIESIHIEKSFQFIYIMVANMFFIFIMYFFFSYDVTHIEKLLHKTTPLIFSIIIIIIVSLIHFMFSFIIH